MKIYTVNDPEFRPYGTVLNMDTSEIIAEAEKIELPEEGSVYVPSVEAFEKTEIKKIIENELFGELPVQTGYCYGHSNMLNALEWHKNSEINIAVTDFILLLGKLDEIEDGRYDSSKVKAFLVKKGEAIEVYATTLHFCPCEVSESGFGCIVALPAGTNTDLDRTPCDKLLFRKNKWIIAHEDNAALIARGVVPGIYGENYKINPMDI